MAEDQVEQLEGERRGERGARTEEILDQADAEGDVAEKTARISVLEEPGPGELADLAQVVQDGARDAEDIGLTELADPACEISSAGLCPCRDGGVGDLGQSAEDENFGLRSTR